MRKKSFKKSPFQYCNEKAFRIISQLAQNICLFLKISRAGLPEKEVEDRKRQFSKSETAHERCDRGLVVFIYQNIY